MVTPQDKALLFYSAPQTKHFPNMESAGTNSILISYWYVRKRPGLFWNTVEYLQKMKGYLMIDSGAFSFKKSKDPQYWKPESYKAYLEEFIQWCYDHAGLIYCTVNLDMDWKVGEHVVDRWNHDYFVPLTKATNVIFNIDPNVVNDPTGIKRAKEYCKQFDYVGTGDQDLLPSLYQLAQIERKRVHGFALTRLGLMRQYPLFSIDSTAWITGERYGNTHVFDGRNFKIYDFKRKFHRNRMKLKAEDIGVNFDTFKGGSEEDPTEVTKWNLHAWAGFEEEYLHTANTKLKTGPVSHYDKRPKGPKPVRNA